MPNVYAYLRVSTDQQDLENQRLEISQYAQENGLEVDGWLEVKASSRKDEKQRKLDVLMNTVKRGDTLIVSELSRLARSMQEVFSLFDELTKQRKVRLHVIKQGIQTKVNGEMDMQTKVLVWAFGMAAELERDLISQRTKNGLARAKAEGKKLGNPQVDKLNQARVEAADDFAERHRSLLEGFKANGMTQRQMVTELNAHGIKTARGCAWTLCGVQRVIKRLGM